MPVRRRNLHTALAVVPVAESAAPVIFPSQRLLRIPQAARYLNRSVWRIRELIHRGELKTVGPEKPFVIDRNDLDAYIERAKKAA